MSTTFSSQKLGDEEFLLAFADDYLGDQLDSADQKRFSDLVSKEKFKQLLDRYKDQHGIFQVYLQSFSLNPEQMEDLWNSVQEPEARQTRELQKIDEVGRSEFFSNLKRRSVLIGLLAIVVFGVVYAFTTQKEPRFEYLEYVRYEALAVDRGDHSVEDWDLADSNVMNILELFKLDKGLKYSPSVVKGDSTGWKAVGGSILDYDSKKLTMVQYKSGIDSFYYFSSSGTLKDLPPSAPGNKDGLVYQTYTSEYYNIIAFEPFPNTLSFIVGRLGAEEMATLAAGHVIKD